MNCSEYGGFIEFPTASAVPYHENAVSLNSGGNSFRYIIRALDICELAVPRYICPIVTKIALQENCKIYFYSIDDSFYPVNHVPYEIPIVYVNYWGTNNKQCMQMANVYKYLILDCAQAFFAPALGWATFYSPRKFFGVPDGGYAVLPETTGTIALERDTSFAHCLHLLQRADGQCESAYVHFIKNEARIRDLPMRAMSRLTERLLSTIDYELCLKIRRKNFLYLHEMLHNFNRLQIDISDKDIPLAYPLLIPGKSIRELLLKLKIYIPKYWPDISMCYLTMFERFLVTNLLTIPVDHRYNTDDMQYIVDILKNAVIDT